MGRAYLSCCAVSASNHPFLLVRSFTRAAFFLPAPSVQLRSHQVPCMTQQLRLCTGTPRGSLGRFLMTIQCPPLYAAWPRSTCPSTCVHLHLYLYPYICTKCDKSPQVMLGHLPTCSVCHNYAQLNMGPHLDQPIWFRASLT